MRNIDQYNRTRHKGFRVRHKRRIRVLRRTSHSKNSRQSPPPVTHNWRQWRKERIQPGGKLSWKGPVATVWGSLDNTQKNWKMMLHPDADGCTKTLNTRKIHWKTEKNSVLKTKTILKPKYQLSGFLIFCTLGLEWFQLRGQNVWLHPQKSSPDTDQGPGGVMEQTTGHVLALLWNQQNYQKLLGTVKCF